MEKEKNTHIDSPKVDYQFGACSFCGHEESWNEWISMIGAFDHTLIKPLDPAQFVECICCGEILCIDYDIIDTR